MQTEKASYSPAYCKAAVCLCHAECNAAQKMKYVCNACVLFVCNTVMRILQESITLIDWS